MIDFIISTIFWTLAFYGLFEIIKKIVFLCTYTKMQADGTYFIIAVKNQENSIEVLLRSILFKILYGKEEYVKNIVITDLNSKDETKEIAKRLEKEYDNIKVMNWNECKEIIDNLEEIE